MNCADCRERLVEVIESALDAEDRAAVEAHLSTCAACREELVAARDLQNRLLAAGRRSRAASNADAVMTSILARRTRQKGKRMLSFTTRNATLAVGLAAAVALIWLATFVTPARNQPGVAFAQVVTPFRTAHTIFMRGTSVDDVATGKPVPIEMSFREPGQSRQVMSNGRIVITDATAGRLLILIPTEKRAIPVKIEQERDMDVFAHLRELVDAQAEFVGTVELDGRHVDLFRTTSEHGVTQVWADPATRLPVRLEMEAIVHPPGKGPTRSKHVIEEIIFDAPLADALFSTQPPPDYTLEEEGWDPLVSIQIVGRNMREILTACVIYAHEHDGEWPEAITGLERYGVMPDKLRSPRMKDRDVAFVYVKPAKDAVRADTVVLYEAYDDFGGGISVGFADGHVQTVSSEEELHRLLNRE